MATEKKTRTKKVKEPVVIEHDPNDLNEVFMGYPDPPSLTLDEVKKEEQVEEPKIEEEPIRVEPTPIIQKEDTYAYAVNEELSIEQKVIKFIEGSNGSHIKMNDLLRSLYPIPKLNEPSISLNQASSKEIRNILDKLSKEGGIEVVSNAHLHLGAPYYPDTSTMKTAYHNLNSVTLVVKKVN